MSQSLLLLGFRIISTTRWGRGDTLDGAIQGDDSLLSFKIFAAESATICAEVHDEMHLVTGKVLVTDRLHT